MPVRLSDDIAVELERAGNQPLRVENPRNHRQYFIVPEELYSSRERDIPAADNGEWSEEKNRRRFALIDKKIAGTLTGDDTVELDCLQHEIDDYLRRVAPLPLSAVRALHEELRRSLNGSSNPVD